MRRRALKRIALALLLLMAVDWAPGLPPDPLLGVAQVRGQQFAPIPASGVINYSTASITAVNSNAEVSMYQTIVPTQLFASATSVGAVGTPIYTGASASGLSTTPLWTTPAPLHFRAVGNIAGAAGTTLNLGVNFGTASVVLANNIIGAITGAAGSVGNPAYVDVWISNIASTTATPNAVNTIFMVARFQYLNASGTLTTTNTSAITNVAASPATLNVVARWGAAASSSTFTLMNRLFKLGD